MEQTNLHTIDIAPPGRHDATVIWLHGLGASGDDFVAMVDELGFPAQHGVRFIFPNAPVRAITVNGGMLMPGWYDIASLSVEQREDEQGVLESQRLITGLIEQQLKLGIQSQRIILGGFSQGGAMSIYTGTRFSKPLGGLLGLSCYSLLASTLNDDRHPANQQTPIFLAHGLFDPVVPYHLGQALASQLQSLNYAVQSQSYPMQHTVSLEEIDDIGDFMRHILFD